VPDFLPGAAAPAKPAEIRDLVGYRELSAPSVAADRGKLIVELPAGASLYIQGHLSRSTREQRHFTSPQLEAGRSYPYDLRVELVRDGKPVVETRTVVVKPGEVVRANFKEAADVSTVQTSGK
jgi:uncharacterized protein (TIGR03000 family)